MAEVRIDGIWLHSLGNVADVKWSTRWGMGPCGSDLASCSVAVSPGIDSPLLRIGRPFEVWSDGVRRFTGLTSEPGRGFPWELNARGTGRRAGDFDAIDSSGDPTTNPQTAATQAAARGLSWTNTSAFPNVSLGDDGAPSMARLDTVLDNSAVTSGARWGVDVNGAAFWTADPTTPTWYLDASDLDIGTADDGLYTRVNARYVSSVDGGTGEPNAWATETADDATAQGYYGVIEFSMDLTPLGLLSGATAASHAAAQLALLTVPQWLNRVTTNAGRLRTKGGLPAHLPSVQAGQMVRLFNVPITLGGLRNELALDVVLGEVEYDTSNPTQVTIAPVGLAVRNLADSLRQAAETAKRLQESASPSVVLQP